MVVKVSDAVLADFDRMWADLEPVGRCDETGGYRRYAWTPEDATLREWFAGECQRRGLTVVVDPGGNQWAWWYGDDESRTASVDVPGVLIGSHLDSVPDGGAFDGPLGVVSALSVLDALREAGFVPTKPLAVANFADEEGARFGVACMGSRIITGAVTPDRVAQLIDRDGISIPAAMTAAGLDASQVGAAPELLTRVGAFVELHVEQGRYLADTEHSVAVGTSIWPHGRWALSLPGEANHAGTTRLEDRNDPMLPLADCIKVAREAARRHGCVATIGKVDVRPGGVNAVPSLARAWLDVRGPVEDDVRAVVAAVGAAGEVEPVQESWTPITEFDPGLIRRCADLLTDVTGPGAVPQLGTGAGHDAGILQNYGVPTVMLFVRNPTGASHTPAESASREDCHAGVTALTAITADLLV